MTDMSDWLTQNHREIGRRADGRSMVLRRTYEAPVEDVWAACTDPDRLSRWLLKVAGDLRPGGTYALEGNAHGEILRCEPPSRLTVTWKYGDLPDSEVELRLTPSAPDSTTLELEHYLLPDDGVAGVGTGWELPLTVALTLYLRGELPESAVDEWYEPGAEHLRLAGLVAQAWIDLTTAHGLPTPAMPPHWT
ncbi:SRPBCC family protein [Nonomuraea sp. NN258]|uniref:SRPBCC family protein n=1 Tax=Nonomuraea antri TaxID=2730852 RepID=UPI00156960FE|nr:SRPBCC family protein [Nonomuraea antri]NRQ39268.1 SRPBCC family protein [Nonomuraea antri]